MRKFLLVFICCITVLVSKSQTLTHIFFNLYTDSLKKGTNNYINVDGKLSNGSYKPLTNKDVVFTTSYGSFEGNDLVIPWDYKQDSCIVTVTSKSDKNLSIKKVIYIKKMEDPDLPASQDVMKKPAEPKKETSSKKNVNVEGKEMGVGF